jgi:hypothetical protein
VQAHQLNPLVCQVPSLPGKSAQARLSRLVTRQSIEMMASLFKWMDARVFV